MTRLHTLAALSILVGGVASAAMPATIGAMRWQRRVLLVASPTPADPNLAQQRRILDGWAKDAADRDISLVTISGTHVEGAADDAAALRKRYALKPSAFQALLIGKDGHIAMRSPEPIAAARLQDTIDAMPMRRDGER